MVWWVGSWTKWSYWSFLTLMILWFCEFVVSTEMYPYSEFFSLIFPNQDWHPLWTSVPWCTNWPFDAGHLSWSCREKRVLQYCAQEAECHRASRHGTQAAQSSWSDISEEPQPYSSGTLDLIYVKSQARLWKSCVSQTYWIGRWEPWC